LGRGCADDPAEVPISVLASYVVGSGVYGEANTEKLCCLAVEEGSIEQLL